MLKKWYMKLAETVQKFPGEKTFGNFRFLPIFFFVGAALEFAEIHWTVGKTNFC